MIKNESSGHHVPMADAGFGSAADWQAPPHLMMGTPDNSVTLDTATRVARPSRVQSAEEARLRVLVGEHFDFIWRSLRRLGVPHTDVDDCAQQVFWVAARKLSMIAEGSERAFLFSTALRVASDARRSRMRRRGVPLSPGTGSP